MVADRSFVRSFTVGAAALQIEDIVTRPPWQRRAACRGASPDLFYETTVTDEAAEMCARCPSRRPCLAWALARGEAGTWGGTDEAQRRAMRREARRGRGAEGEPAPGRGPQAIAGLGARRST